MVKMWVANTDPEWFDYLASQPDIDEVNFWQPSGNNQFNAIQPGELLLFKLKAPRNAIGGFGVLSQASNLPLSLSWEAFGTKNGARTFQEMRARVDQYRPDARSGVDYTIGCRIVVQPVFLPEHLWIPQPTSWSRSIVVGKVFDTSEREGLSLWERVHEVTERLNLSGRSSAVQQQHLPFFAEGPRFGEPQLIRPRLGQGAFRLAVTDAYKRQCAISGGRVLPALDAAHIQAYGEGGVHEVSNGILLRKDIHCVFDAGYITFDENMRMIVSDRVRTEFNNGNEYRRLHGEQLKIPREPALQPNPDFLRWHRENRFAA
jgi:putative restriction endonuclease